MITNNNIANFSTHLFWDVDRNNLDFKKNAKYIINSVLQYGLYNDWKLLVNQYSLKKITEVAKNNKQLDEKTASFIALISKTPIQNFLCFSTKQSAQKHWNF